jgi:hypothetical protein
MRRLSVQYRTLACLLWLPLISSAVIIDRIAIVVENYVIKDSDIEQDIRITDFLNSENLSFSEADRKKAAQKLIDQELIRREIDLSGSPKGTPEEAGNFLKSISQQHFQNSEAAYREALSKYGISDSQLRSQLAWQLTVLHFIEQRFRPAVLVSDEDMDKYVHDHPQLSRDAAREQLTEERVNDAFEAWLNQRRKRADIEYHETGLQ